MQTKKLKLSFKDALGKTKMVSIDHPKANLNDEIVKAHRKSKNAYRTLPQAEDTIQVLKQQRKKTVSSP